MSYDAILILSFGGPERREDVMPFLENVLRGKNVPRERMLEVAEHYDHFGGVSPINGQCRALIAALERELAEHGPRLPIYWGNRNWHPLLSDTLTTMRDDGIQSALAFATSAFSSYSSCRQYQEDIARAQAAVGDGAPQVEKLRPFFNHPGFLEPMIEQTRAALAQIPADRRATTHVVYTAHSIPLAMSAGCDYSRQLFDACAVVSGALDGLPWKLVFQSRSGPPSQPWLEPDIGDYLRALQSTGSVTDVVVVPIGFTSDHMEVLFDLDYEAKSLCVQLGLTMHRVPTVGCHPAFIRMIRTLIVERTGAAAPSALGKLGPRLSPCAEGCCPSGRPLAIRP